MPLSIGSIPMPIMKKKNIKWLIRQESHNYRVYLEKVPLKKQELANNEILVYVEWDCPTTKQTETVVIYAPQDYVFLQDESLANAAFAGKSCTYL